MTYEEVICRWVEAKQGLDLGSVSDVTFSMEAYHGCPTCGDFGADVEITYTWMGSPRYMSIDQWNFGAFIQELVEFAKSQ